MHFQLIKDYIVTYVYLVVASLAVLFVTSRIPVELIYPNMGSSLELFKAEGLYPSFGFSGRQIALDNFTDAIIFNTAYSIDDIDPFKSTMLGLRAVASPNENDQIVNFESLVIQDNPQKVYYERYWHGYLAYLRPLLVVFSYREIRYVLQVFLLFGAFLLLWHLWKYISKVLVIALLLAMVAVDFIYVGQSIQFSSVFLIGIYSSLYYVFNYKKLKNSHKIFFIVGGLTAFFDLLTAPLISLGFLLAISTVIEKKDTIFLKCLLWGMGYVLLWSTKWVLVEFLILPGAITTAFDQVINRTISEPDSNFTHWKAITVNFWQLVGYSKFSKVSVLGLCLSVLAISIRYFKFTKKIVLRLIPWIKMFFIPYIWYLVAANHSYLHVWYTYRTQFISVFACTMVWLQMLDWSKIKRDMNYLKGRII